MTATAALPLALPVTDEFVSAIAQRVAGLLDERPATGVPQSSPWMTVTDVAGYIRAPTSRIYALKSARRIPFHKDGSRLLFHRAEIDAWLRAGGAIRP